MAGLEWHADDYFGDWTLNLLQKYIHAVKQELPLAQREDIGRELQANILDQLDAIQEQTGREASQYDIAAVLEKHGHPS